MSFRICLCKVLEKNPLKQPELTSTATANPMMQHGDSSFSELVRKQSQIAEVSLTLVLNIKVKINAK